jgi:hypothetical protein
MLFQPSVKSKLLPQHKLTKMYDQLIFGAEGANHSRTPLPTSLIKKQIEIKGDRIPET